MTSVAQLRYSGHKVKVCHRRWYLTDELRPKYYLFSRYELNEWLLHNQMGPPVLGPLSTGGLTTVEITTPDNNTVIASSECSDTDNFNRKFGLTKAVGRALGQLKEIN